MRGPEGEAGELGLSVKCTGLAIPEEYVFWGFCFEYLCTPEFPSKDLINYNFQPDDEPVTVW